MRFVVVSFIVVFLISLPATCFSAGTPSCVSQSPMNGACHQSFVFSKPLGKEEKISVEKAVKAISDIVLTKDTGELVNHENELIKASDLSGIDKAKSDFLFGEGPSATVPRKSVRQIILGSEKLAIYVEPHDVWETYKGDLYIVIFFDSSKISLGKLSKDLGHGRLLYMSDYAATLIKLDGGTWSFPETPFFWETDGP